MGIAAENIKKEMKADPIVINCPECGNNDIVADATKGDVICTYCGLVLDTNLIDTSAEWRAFNVEEFDKKARVGAPSTFTIHDKGLSTMIDWRDRDALGHKLSPKKRAEAYRLRKWQIRMRVHSSMDRNLAFAMSELERLSSQMGFQRTTRESAAMLYRKVIEKNLIRGRSIEAMVAASIYLACRMSGIPNTLDEFASNSRIGKRELGRCFRLILMELRIRLASPTPCHFVARIGNELNLSNQSQQIAIKILNGAKKFGITAGKDPSGMAAASIYIAALHTGEHKTQREIARIANITEVTVRNRYREIVKCLKLKIESNIEC